MSQYTDEFKKQIVNLYNNEKAPSEIIKKYKIARKRGKYRRKKAFINFCSHLLLQAGTKSIPRHQL